MWSVAVGLAPAVKALAALAEVEEVVVQVAAAVRCVITIHSRRSSISSSVR